MFFSVYLVIMKRSRWVYKKLFWNWFILNFQACAKHAEAANDGDFFKVYRLSEELRADSLISLPLKHNNDDHSMALFFNCVSSCLKGRESKSKELRIAYKNQIQSSNNQHTNFEDFIGCFCMLDSLNFSFFLREKVEDGHGLQLDLTYRRTIRNLSQKWIFILNCELKLWI